MVEVLQRDDLIDLLEDLVVLVVVAAGLQVGIDVLRQRGVEGLAPVLARYLREIALIAQKIIDDQHPGLIDALFDRFVVTVGSLVEWEGKWLGHLGRASVVWVSLLNFDGHIKR